jgi:hypothetical protein
MRMRKFKMYFGHRVFKCGFSELPNHMLDSDGTPSERSRRKLISYRSHIIQLGLSLGRKQWNGVVRQSYTFHLHSHSICLHLHLPLKILNE